VEESYRQEIIRMHQIIAAWLSGNVPQTHDAFAPFEDVLAADFHLVHPSGVVRDKAQVGPAGAFAQEITVGSIRCFLHPIGSLYNREKLVHYPIGKAPHGTS